jgi:hypothetical protein
LDIAYFAFMLFFLICTVIWLRQIAWGGDQPVLVDISPGSLRIFSPRQVPQEMIIPAERVRLIEIRRCGWTFSGRRRYSFAVLMQFDPSHFWENSTMHYFTVDDRDFPIHLREALRAKGYYCGKAK